MLYTFYSNIFYCKWYWSCTEFFNVGELGVDAAEPILTRLGPGQFLLSLIYTLTYMLSGLDTEVDADD